MSSSTSNLPSPPQKHGSEPSRAQPKLWSLLLATGAGCLVGVMLSGIVRGRSESAHQRVVHIPASLAHIEHELRAILQEAKRAGTDDLQLRQKLNAAVDQLARGDFAVAAQHALQLPPQHRTEVLQALVQRWAGQDGGSAMRFAMAITDIDLRDTLAQTALQHWTETAPAAALAWVKAQLEGQLREELLEKFVATAEWNDTALALTAVEAMQRGARKESLRLQMASRLAERDLAAGMLALLRGPQDHPGSESLREAFAARWVAKDLQGALHWGNQLADAEQRKVFFASLVAAWANTDREAALKWIQQQPSANRGKLFSSVFTTWLKTDVNGASAYALAMPRGQERDAAIYTIACELGLERKDLSGMLELHAHLGPLRQSYLPQLFLEIAHRNGEDLRAGAEIVRNLPPDKRPQTFLDEYLYHWMRFEPDQAAQYMEEDGLLAGAPKAAWRLGLRRAEQDLESALEWARKLPAGTARNEALWGVLVAVSWNDGTRAADLLTRELGAGAVPEAARHIVQSWVLKEPEAAAAWVSTLKDESTQVVAWRALISHLADSNPTGTAAQWLDTLSPGVVRDIAVSTFAEKVLSTDPEGALAWAATIQDPDQRQLQLEQLATRWMHTNRSAATEWITSSEFFSPATRQWLLRKRAP